MKLKSILMKILSWICVAIFVLITIIGTYQVATRYLFNNPSAWTEELLSFGFAWMAILAAAYVFGKRDHMRLTFIIDKWDIEKKKIVEIVNEVLIIIFTATIFVYGGIKLVGLTIKQISPALQISTGIVYSVIPIAGVLIIIFSILNIIEISRGEWLSSSNEGGTN